MRYWGDERTVTKTGKFKRTTRESSEAERAGRPNDARSRTAATKSRVARPGAVRLTGGPRSDPGRMPVVDRIKRGSTAGGSRSGGGSRRAGGRTGGGRKDGGKSQKGSSIAAGGSLKNYPFLRRLYRHQAQISERVQKILFFLILAGIIYAFLLGENGFVRIAMLRAERAQLDADITALTRSEALLTEEIERLKTDDFYIEKMGRERFGYLKPGDRVYRLIPIDDRGM